MNKYLILGTAIILLVGCNQTSDELTLVPVSGKVTYQGEPIQHGVIYLVPLEGIKSPARMTNIKDGAYQFVDRAAVGLGTYRVQINAYRGESTELPADRNPSEKKDRPKQYLPKKFNKHTTIPEFTVKAGDTKIKKDFDLK